MSVSHRMCGGGTTLGRAEASDGDKDVVSQGDTETGWELLGGQTCHGLFIILILCVWVFCLLIPSCLCLPSAGNKSVRYCAPPYCWF